MPRVRCEPPGRLDRRRRAAGAGRDHGEELAVMQLQEIPWGQPDPVLGKMVCRHIVDREPAIVIPYNPIKHAKLLKELGHLGIYPFTQPRENDHAV